MMNVVLVVESDALRRAAIGAALASRSRAYVEAADLYQALAAIGRAEFGAMIIREPRAISLRAACRLARKRHPGIRVFVSLTPGLTPEQLQSAAGIAIDVTPDDLGPDELAQQVDDALSLMQLADPETLNTTQVHLDVEAALAMEEGLEAPPQTAPDGALLEGSLDDGNGAALLMGLYAQQVTGILHVVKGPAAGNLYFFRGEPTWFTHPTGDRAILNRLVERGLVKPDARVQECPEGQLLSVIATENLADVEDLHTVLLEMLRERLLALATQSTGAWRFTEDHEFINSVPILKANVFGLILESRKKQMTPDRVLVLGAEMAKQYMVPGPALKQAAPRIAQFTRGVRVDEIVDGSHTVREFYDATRLDQMMGALVMLVLVDTHLVTLEPRPLGAHGNVELHDVAPPAAWDGPVLPEVTMEIDAAEAHQKAFDDVLRIYFKLKPLTVPAQVLGIPMFSDPEQIESAYWQRMKELENRPLPPGALAAVMQFRIEEIRRKLTRAYQAMMSTMGPMARVGR